MISVVIPVLNAHALLPRCFDSLIGATVTFSGCICNGPGICSSLGGVNFCARVCGQ